MPYFDDPLTLKLQRAQLVIAREHGFKSWCRLKTFIEVRDARMEAVRGFYRLTKRWMSARPNIPMAAQTLQPLARRKSASGAASADALRCSFCDRSQHEVDKLVAGGPGTFVCSDCVSLCAELVGAQSAEPS